MKYTTMLLALGASVLPVAAVAAPATFTFSYQASDGLFVGSGAGMLQPGGGVVAVTDLTASFTPNGGSSIGPFTFPFIFSATGFISGSLTPGILSTSGAENDFLACFDSDCNDGFAFVPAGTLAPIAAFTSGNTFGYAFEPFNAGGWSFEPVGGVVPEPASWAMMIAGFGLVGAAMRRKARGGALAAA